MRDISVHEEGNLNRSLRYPAILKFSALLALVVFAYYQSLSAMVVTWLNSEAYSHGFIIPVISGFLLWKKRESLKNTRIATNSRGFILLLGGLTLFLAGNLAFESFTVRVSLLLVVAGLVYLHLGKEFFGKIAFPLGYLLFMIPLPHIIMKGTAVGLKLAYATITYKIISLTPVPIVQEGVRLELPNASLVVADFCTGILSILAITALSVLYAYLTQRTWAARISLVLIAVPIALVSNLFRLITTVWLTYYLGMGVLDSVIHQFHGTFNFLITIALLVLTGKFMSRIEEKRRNGDCDKEA